MKTFDQIRVELRDAAIARGVDLGFDPMQDSNLDRMMRACDVMLGPPGHLPPPASRPAVPTPATTPSSSTAPVKAGASLIVGAEPAPTGYNRVVAAYAQQLRQHR